MLCTPETISANYYAWVHEEDNLSKEMPILISTFAEFYFISFFFVYDDHFNNSRITEKNSVYPKSVFKRIMILKILTRASKKILDNNFSYTPTMNDITI